MKYFLVKTHDLISELKFSQRKVFPKKLAFLKAVHGPKKGAHFEVYTLYPLFVSFVVVPHSKKTPVQVELQLGFFFSRGLQLGSVRFSEDFFQLKRIDVFGKSLVPYTLSPLKFFMVF